jgi:hypothetical protein
MCQKQQFISASTEHEVSAECDKQGRKDYRKGQIWEIRQGRKDFCG